MQARLGVDAKGLKGDWSKIGRLVPYGFGAEARKSLHRIFQDFSVPFIVDQSEEKQGQSMEGVRVVSPEALRDLQAGDKVVVTIAKRRYNEVSAVLSEFGLREGEDFCHLSHLITDWYPQYAHTYCLASLHIALTMACTLNCAHCNMFVPYHKSPYMASPSDIQRDLKLFFDRMDYVFSVDLIGGEALLNPGLPAILEEIHTKYHARIGQVNITTNAVVLPKPETVAFLRRYGVFVAISDYTEAIGERAHVEELVRMLDAAGVPVSVMKNRVWTDFGFPAKPWLVSEEEARTHMMTCDPGWRGLNDGRLYFCHVAWSIERAGKYRLRKGDFLELKDLPPHEEATKQRILRYCQGELGVPYMSFCRVCGGCGADNPSFVLAGEQA